MGHWVFLRPNKTLRGEGEAQPPLAQSLYLSPASAVISSWPWDVSKASCPCLAPVWYQIPGGLAVTVSKCYLLLPPHSGGTLSPPGPSMSLTIISPSHTQLQVVSPALRATGDCPGDTLDFGRGAVATISFIRACPRGSQGCVVGGVPGEPEPPQNCFGKVCASLPGHGAHSGAGAGDSSGAVVPRGLSGLGQLLPVGPARVWAGAG